MNATTPRAGLYRKFTVERTDGSSAPGGKHERCEYFVLDLDHDKHAAAALRAYADSCRAELPELARDLVALAVRKPETCAPLCATCGRVVANPVYAWECEGDGTVDCLRAALARATSERDALQSRLTAAEAERDAARAELLDATRMATASADKAREAIERANRYHDERAYYAERATIAEADLADHDRQLAEARGLLDRIEALAINESWKFLSDGRGLVDGWLAAYRAATGDKP